MRNFKFQNIAYESCKPLSSWICDLVQRVDFFNTWSDVVISVAEKAFKPINVQPQRPDFAGKVHQQIL